MAFAVMEKLSLAATARTLQLQYRSESGTLCYLQGRISFLIRRAVWHDYLK